MTTKELDIQKIDNEVLFLGLKLYLTDGSIKKKKDIFELGDKDIMKYIKRKKISADIDNNYVYILQGNNILLTLPVKEFYK